MSHLNKAASDMNLRANKPFHPEHLEAYARANDIDDRIHCPHFMEVNPINISPVNFRFSLGETPEDRSRTFFDLIGNPRFDYDPFDIRQMPMLFLVRYRYVRVDRSNSRPVHLCKFDIHIDRRDVLQFADKVIGLDPERSKAPEDHVAARAGKAIEIKCAHEIESIA